MDALAARGLLFILKVGLSLLALCMLVVMSIIHACVCLRRGLLLFPCYPTRFSTALNAATLGLVTGLYLATLGFLFTGCVSIECYDCGILVPCMAVCGVMGACLPSIAAADRRQMWGNVAGAAVLLINFLSRVLFRALFYESFLFHFPAIQQSCSMLTACLLVFFFLLLIMYALGLDEMLCELEACVAVRLRQRTQEKAAPISYVYTQAQHKRTIMRWSWEALKREACVKFMMALTSNPENVASRSPFLTIASLILIVAVGKAVSLALALHSSFLWVFFPFTFMNTFLVPMCLSRCVSVAICETRPLSALLLDRRSCDYGRQKLTNLLHRLRAPCPYRPLVHLRSQPTSIICQLLTFSLKSLLYYVLRIIASIHRMLLVAIMFVHLLFAFQLHVLIKALSRLLVRKRSMNEPSPDLSRSSFREAKESSTSFIPVDVDLAPGVVCIPGEDVRMVEKLFERPARRAIRRQSKKASKQPFQALEALLRLSKHSCHLKKDAILEVLEQQGAYECSDVVDPRELLMQYGEQYGWSLTILSLLAVMSQVEVECCGELRVSMSAIEAYKQAADMIDIVEEMQAPRTVCSKETYLSASRSLWRSLLHEGRPWWQRISKDVKVKSGGTTNVLDQQLEFARMQFKKYGLELPWTMEIMKAYTMYTVCSNLQRWCEKKHDVEELMEPKDNKTLVEHIYYLIAEVLTGCLYALPIVLDAYIIKAIQTHHPTRIKVCILAICQAQRIWENLKWPQHMVLDPSIHFSIVVAGLPLNEFWLQHDVCASRKHACTYKHSRSWPQQRLHYEV